MITLEDIFTEVQTITGVDECTIKSQSRVRNAVYARAIVVQILRKELGMIYSDIGLIICRTPAAAIYLRTLHDNMVDIKHLPYIDKYTNILNNLKLNQK